MTKALVVINSAHNLFLQQTELLNNNYKEEGWQRLNVPEEGWNAEEQVNQLNAIADNIEIVFASPLPLMLKLAAKNRSSVWVFHNDNRVAKEVGPPPTIANWYTPSRPLAGNCCKSPTPNAQPDAIKKKHRVPRAKGKRC